MTTAVSLLTADELARMPDDGYRYELVQGELRQMSPTNHTHGRIAMNFAGRLWQHVEDEKLGAVYAAETGFLITRDPDTVRAPDVAFVSQARAVEVTDPRGYFPGAPDLAVEVISPSETHSEVQEKAMLWLDAGARIVVTLDERRRAATVYRSKTSIAILSGDDVLDLDPVVPGFSVRVGDLFA